MLGFFAAEFQGFFADLGGALEEIEATIVLGEAFAGDLDALDIKFEFFVALHVAREEGEVFVGGVGRRGARKELALEGGGDGGIENGIFASAGGLIFRRRRRWFWRLRVGRRRVRPSGGF